jgi:hypothetical protein
MTIMPLLNNPFGTFKRSHWALLKGVIDVQTKDINLIQNISPHSNDIPNGKSIGLFQNIHSIDLQASSKENISKIIN